MPEINLVFLDIEKKQDSVEKLAAVVGKPTKEHLFAGEINLVVKKINQLKQLLDAVYSYAWLDGNNQIIPIGEIGELPIHIVVRGLEPPQSIQADYLRIFRATRSGVEHNYLYSGQGGLVGVGQHQPNAVDFYAISGNIFANGDEVLVTDPTAAPNEVTTILQVVLNNLYNAVPNLERVLTAGNTAIAKSLKLVLDAELPNVVAQLNAIELNMAKGPENFIKYQCEAILFRKGSASLALIQGNANSTMELLTPKKPSGTYTIATKEDMDLKADRKYSYSIPGEVSITGVTGPVVVMTASILANSLPTFVNLRMQAILERTNGSNGTTTHFIYLSQSLTFDIATAVQIGRTVDSQQVYLNIDRDFDIINDTLVGYPFNVSSYTGSAVTTTARGATPFNRAVNNYIHYVVVVNDPLVRIRMSRGNLIQI